MILPGNKFMLGPAHRNSVLRPCVISSERRTHAIDLPLFATLRAALTENLFSGIKTFDHAPVNRPGIVGVFVWQRVWAAGCAQWAIKLVLFCVLIRRADRLGSSVTIREQLICA